MCGTVDYSVVYRSNTMFCVDIGFNILNIERTPSVISTVRMVPSRRTRNDRTLSGEFPRTVFMGSKIVVLRIQTLFDSTEEGYSRHSDGSC